MTHYRAVHGRVVAENSVFVCSVECFFKKGKTYINHKSQAEKLMLQRQIYHIFDRFSVKIDNCNEIIITIIFKDFSEQQQ